MPLKLAHIVSKALEKDRKLRLLSPLTRSAI